MSNKITISGGVVAEPETKVISDSATVLSFPLYDNERRKNRDTQEYEPTGNVTKLRVQLWNDLAREWAGKINVGDIVEIEGTIVEREYDKKDGTKGRSLETSFVNSVRVVYSKSGASSEVDAFAPAGGGW